MDDYSDFFLNTRSNIYQLELLELSHRSFTQTYRIARNGEDDGVTVDLGLGEQGVYFGTYPARISSTGSRDDMDAGLRIELGDLGEVVPREIDAVAEAGDFLTKPALRYWVFRSDRLTSPIYGPLNLEIPSFNFNTQGVSFEARAPSLNVTRTGERYKLDRFTPLQGYI